MGPLLLAIVLSQGQPAAPRRGQQENAEFLARRSEANSKFRNMINAAKTLSVQVSIKQDGNPIPGQGVLLLSKPDKIYFNLDWGRKKFVYAINGGQATEIDTSEGVYNEYAVPGWTGPASNGSDIASFFPTIFVSENILLPPNCFDQSGRLVRYAIGSGQTGQAKRNVVTFSDYKVNVPIPDSKFKVSIPAGLTAYGIPQPAPPLQIGDTLPDIKLTTSAGQKTELSKTLDGGKTFLALLDPTCAPSVASLQTVRGLKGVKVVILNADPKGSGLKADGLLTYHSGPGALASALRAPMTPLYFLVDSKRKVLNVWYGFDRKRPDMLGSQVAAALSGQSD